MARTGEKKDSGNTEQERDYNTKNTEMKRIEF